MIPPHFIIIGAQRCGTTSLFEYLIRHPKIIAPVQKELHYFDLFYEKGDAWYKDQFHPHWKITQRHAGLSVKPISGEASPYYLFHPLVAKRVAHDLPNCKFIVLLRDPIERAFSHYKHKVKLGHETLSFFEAIKAEPKRLKGELKKIKRQPDYHSDAYQSFSYVQRGIYINQLKNWFRYFSREQFLILSSETFYSQPSEVMSEVVSFLGLEHHRWKRFEVFNQIKGETMEPQTRQYLSDYYRPLNRRLYRLLGRDFQWG